MTVHSKDVIDFLVVTVIFKYVFVHGVASIINFIVKHLFKWGVARLIKTKRDLDIYRHYRDEGIRRRQR